MRAHLIIGLILAGIIGVGCDQADSTSVTPAPAGAGDATAPAGGATDAATKDAAGTADAAKKQAAGAIEGAKAAGDQATSAIQGDAQKLLDQALQYIKENNLDLAEQTLVKLEGMKAQLPETMQKGIAQARGALDTAKSAEKAKGSLPGGLGR